MLSLRHITLPAALCATLLALPAAADTVSSYARAYAGGQLCGAGPAPNCTTSLLFESLGPPVEVSTATSEGLFQAEQNGSFDYWDDASQRYGRFVNHALANLNTGSVHLLNYTSVLPRPSGAGNAVARPRAYGFSSAWLGDTFAVLNADGSAYSGTDASVLSIRLVGALYGTADSNQGFGAQITLGRPGYLAAVAAQDFAGAAALRIDSASTGWLTAGQPVPADLSVAVPATLHSFEWMVTTSASYDFRQSDVGSIYAYVDLSQGITVGLQTPSGTVFSSATGLFPGSVPAAPVPEPASWALLMAGGGWLLSRSRCRCARSPA